MFFFWNSSKNIPLTFVIFVVSETCMYIREKLLVSSCVVYLKIKMIMMIVTCKFIRNTSSWETASLRCTEYFIYSEEAIWHLKVS
jgi:hypothetical protein